jgi:hypothetical protein
MGGGEWRVTFGAFLGENVQLLDILEEADAEGISLILRLRSIDVVIGEMGSTIA